MYMKDENKSKKSIPNIVIYLGLIILMVLFIGFAIYFSTKDVLDIIVSKITYKEDYSIGYRVYYEENPFYSDPYLGEDKTYISKYIDKIDVDYSYLVDYSDTLDGSYDYYVRAKLIAYSPGKRSEELWDNEYKITDVETVDFKQDSNYHVNKNISINFQRYKNEYDEYREGTAISSEAVLLIQLFVNNHGSYSSLEDFDYESVLTLEIPISDETFKISTLSTIRNEENKVTKTESASFEKTLIIIIACLLWILAIVTLVGLISFYKINEKKLSYYEKRLKKILTSFDSVIVNVENLPSLTGLNVVDVTTFEELMDAQSEVRLPINFNENKKKKIAKFVLISNDLAWVYTLKEQDQEEN